MDRRIAAPKGFDSLLEAMVDKLSGEGFALFQTKQKAMMFAPALGFKKGKRTPLDQRDASTAIRHDIFEKARDDGFMSALAIASTDELGVLADLREDELATIFEEYAHTGLLELRRKVMENPKPLDALVDMILAVREPEAPSDLPGMDPEVLGNLMR